MALGAFFRRVFFADSLSPYHVVVIFLGQITVWGAKLEDVDEQNAGNEWNPFFIYLTKPKHMQRAIMRQHANSAMREW